MTSFPANIDVVSKTWLNGPPSNIPKIRHFTKTEKQKVEVQNSNLSVEERFEARKNHLSDTCEKKGLSGLDSHLVEERSFRPSILYLDNYEMIYCAIPKVRCSLY